MSSLQDKPIASLTQVLHRRCTLKLLQLQSTTLNPMQKRVQVHLDEETYNYLKEKSERERRKPGNLASLWVVERIEAEKKQDKTQPEDG